MANQGKHRPPNGIPGSLSRVVTSSIWFRCFPVVLFFTGWSTVVTFLNSRGHEIYVESTLLNVFGTVLGFVISYATTSSYEKYDRGRMLWNDIVFASRNFARVLWFHVPESAESPDRQKKEEDQKKAVIDLLGAFSVAVKHHLRRENGIYYTDLYPSVKFLPVFVELTPEHKNRQEDAQKDTRNSTKKNSRDSTERPCRSQMTTITSSDQPYLEGRTAGDPAREGQISLRRMDPPGFGLSDLVPFCFLSELVPNGSSSDCEAVSHLNVPLEISLYLSSYINNVQQRKGCELGTIVKLTEALETLLKSFASLESILVSPMYSSFARHLWSSTTIFCLILPIMIWPQFQWETIPATAILTFLFFGFLVAGKELGDPFGYDKNDLNLDEIVTGIKKELAIMTGGRDTKKSYWTDYGVRA